MLVESVVDGKKIDFKKQAVKYNKQAPSNLIHIF